MVEVVLLDDEILGRSGTSDDYALQILNLRQPVVTCPLGRLLEEIVGGLLNEAFETLGRLASSAVLGWNL